MTIEITSEQRKLLNCYLAHILEANTTMNLTRIKSIDEARILHIEDSLVALPEMMDAPQGRYGDLGSGGGFPGVPLAIITGRETVLIDSVKKKMSLVSSILNSMGLSDTISTCDLRIEELSSEQPESFSVLTARALTRLNSLLELAAPLLSQNGQLICYKAQLPEGELKEALAMAHRVGMSFLSQRAVLLSDGVTERTILVFQKVSDPEINLPRRVGKAQRNPLK